MQSKPRPLEKASWIATIIGTIIVILSFFFSGVRTVFGFLLTLGILLFIVGLLPWNLLLSPMIGKRKALRDGIRRANIILGTIGVIFVISAIAIYLFGGSKVSLFKPTPSVLETPFTPTKVFTSTTTKVLIPNPTKVPTSSPTMYVSSILPSPSNLAILLSKPVYHGFAVNQWECDSSEITWDYPQNENVKFLILEQIEGTDWITGPESLSGYTLLNSGHYYLLADPLPQDYTVTITISAYIISSGEAIYSTPTKISQQCK